MFHRSQDATDEKETLYTGKVNSEKKSQIKRNTYSTQTNIDHAHSFLLKIDEQLETLLRFSGR